MAGQESHQTAAQQALLQQVSQYIGQYTPEPRIISYAPNASGDVMGKFSSQGRVFTFRLSNKGLVYKPVVARKDGESDIDYAARFDTGSELWLEHFDAVKAPAPKTRGTKALPNCSAISYHCGVCISLGKNCIKNANTAALKERLTKINSLSRMVAKGQPVPQVKTGAIGARVDPKSLKKKASDFAKKQAGGVKSTNPKAVNTVASAIKKVSDSYNPNSTKAILTEDDYVNLHGAQFKANAAFHRNPRGVTKTLQKAKDDQARENEAIQQVRNKLREDYSQKVSKGEIRPPSRFESLARTANGHDDNETVQAARSLLKKRGLDYKNLELDKDGLIPSPKQSTKDRQAAQRAAAEPNKTTTLSTPLPLTAQSQKRLERGEFISDNETYHVKKEGNKFRVTDPNKFEDEGKLVDKAGLAAHMKELEAKPSTVKKSSSMNPAIPMSNNPDTMLRALRDGRLIGDAKQGYEIQNHPTEKGSYLVTTMPNKVGGYSGTLSKKELVDFVKSGGDASKFNRESKAAKPSPKIDRQAYKGINNALPESLDNDKKSTIARRIADLNYGQEIITDY